MFKKIDKLIIKKFIGPFILIFFTTIFILFYQFISTELHGLLQKNISGWRIYLKIIFYFCISLIPSASALSVLLSSLIAFGSLGQHSELIAIKNAGVSLPRILLPAFFFVIIISSIIFFFNNTAIPNAHLKLKKLVLDIREEKPTANLSKGIFHNEIPGYSIKMEDESKNREYLYDLMIYDHTLKKGNIQVMLADSGKISYTLDKYYMVMELFDGNSFHESTTDEKDVVQFVKNTFSYGKMFIPMEKKNQHENAFELEYKMMSIKSLRANYKHTYNNLTTLRIRIKQEINLFPLRQKIDNSEMEILLLAEEEMKKNLQKLTKKASIAQTLREETRNYAIEITRRYIDTLAILIMFLIGAPIGIIIKRAGIGIPILLAMFFFSCYSFLLNFGFKAAKQAALSVEIGCWLSPVVMSIIGFFFLNQARKDSHFFELDFYLISLSKVLKVFKLKKMN